MDNHAAKIHIEATELLGDMIKVQEAIEKIDIQELHRISTIALTKVNTVRVEVDKMHDQLQKIGIQAVEKMDS